MLERTVRNISSETQPYWAQVDTDEWGFPNAKLQIIECEVRDEAGTVHRMEQVEDRGHYLHAETKKVSIPPQACAFISSKFSEVRRIDDHMILVSMTPTRGPEIEVRIPSDLEYEVSFGHPNEVVRKAKYSSRHTMVGTYFPNQAMRLRWWRKPTTAEECAGS
jgi:hypothetical protein